MRAKQRRSGLLTGILILIPLLFLSACQASPKDMPSSEASRSGPEASPFPTAERKSTLKTASDSGARLSPSPSPESGEASEETAAEPPWALASLTASAPLYSAPGDVYNIRDTIPAGKALRVIATEDPLWYALISDSAAAVLKDEDTLGYLYGEQLYRLDETGGTAAQSLFEEYAAERFARLREDFPEGKYWNHMGMDLPFGEETPFIVTDVPCDHYENGEYYCNFYNGKTEELFYSSTLCECLGFASLLSDQLFGVEPDLHVHNDYDLLRVGDHIRLEEYEHSMTVVEKTDDYIVIAEVNQNYNDCLISWTRELSRWELIDLSWDSEYISRYPLCPDGNGGYVPWD